MINFKGNVFAFTDGKGYWSGAVARVKLLRLEVPHINEEESYGELRLYFDTDTWNVGQQGLIYTDPFFLIGLRNRLVTKLQFSRAAVDEVCYSEQGMQGDDYVSFDVDQLFLDEWLAKTCNTQDTQEI